MMRRREFIAVLGATATWPAAVSAQPREKPLIGFLNVTSAAASTSRVRAFLQGLNELGFVPGSTVTIEYRWADYHYDQLPALAADLVQRGVDVIAATSVAAADAAKAATSTIPIVFYVGGDPIQAGLVASLSRPGANLTGVSNLFASGQGAGGQKRLEMLHEVAPAARTIDVLVNPTSRTTVSGTSEIEAAAHALGLKTRVLEVATEGEIEAKLTRSTQDGIHPLLIAADLLFLSVSELFGELTARLAIPAIHQAREFALAGGLMSYGSNFTDSYRQLGLYAGRMLKGAKPGDLPVLQTSRVELVINLKTARALGWTIPLPLLGRADEVIE